MDFLEEYGRDFEAEEVGANLVFAHRLPWEVALHAQGLKPRDVNPWYGVFRDVHDDGLTEMTGLPTD